MGKKISQSSVKISRKEKQLHSLIQVLRPKVYITDSLSFKSLVQQLTGNLTSSSPHHHPIKLDDHDHRVVVENVSITDHTKEESSMELASSFASPDDSSHQIALEDHSTVNPPDHDHDRVDMLAYQDLESWLLEMEPFPFFHDYAQMFEQEVSIYDYELSGLI
jgi:hypothetical protein